MANPERSEVAVTIDGTDYLLKFSTNAIVALETETGERAIPFVKRLGTDIRAPHERPETKGKTKDKTKDKTDEPELVSDMGIGDLRVLTWAGLRDHHAQLSLADVGDLMDQARQAGVSLVEPVMEAFGLALAEITGGNPRRPARSRRTKTTTAGRGSSPRRSRPGSTPPGSGA